MARMCWWWASTFCPDQPPVVADLGRRLDGHQQLEVLVEVDGLNVNGGTRIHTQRAFNQPKSFLPPCLPACPPPSLSRLQHCPPSLPRPSLTPSFHHSSGILHCHRVGDMYLVRQVDGHAMRRVVIVGDTAVRGPGLLHLDQPPHWHALRAGSLGVETLPGV